MVIRPTMIQLRRKAADDLPRFLSSRYRPGSHWRISPPYGCQRKRTCAVRPYSRGRRVHAGVPPTNLRRQRHRRWLFPISTHFHGQGRSFPKGPIAAADGFRNSSAKKAANMSLRYLLQGGGQQQGQGDQSPKFCSPMNPSRI